MAIYGPGQAAQPRANTFRENLFGRRPEYNQVTNYDPRQLQSFAQVGQMGLRNQQNPYEGFQPIEEQATRNFNTQTVPGLAERFAGANALNSSGFAGALGAAGAGLQGDLAALRAQYGQRQQEFGLQQSQFGNTQQYDTQYEPGQEGWLSQAAGQGANLLGQGALMYATGGLSGAEGVSSLIGKGVKAFQNRGQQQSPFQQRLRQMPGGQQRQLYNNTRAQYGAQQLQPQFNQAQQTAQGINQQYPNVGGNTRQDAMGYDIGDSTTPLWPQLF